MRLSDFSCKLPPNISGLDGIENIPVNYTEPRTVGSEVYLIHNAPDWYFISIFKSVDDYYNSAPPIRNEVFQKVQ